MMQFSTYTQIQELYRAGGLSEVEFEKESYDYFLKELEFDPMTVAKKSIRILFLAQDLLCESGNKTKYAISTPFWIDREVKDVVAYRLDDSITWNFEFYDNELPPCICLKGETNNILDIRPYFTFELSASELGSPKCNVKIKIGEENTAWFDSNKIYLKMQIR